MFSSTWEVINDENGILAVANFVQSGRHKDVYAINRMNTKVIGYDVYLPNHISPDMVGYAKYLCRNKHPQVRVHFQIVTDEDGIESLKAI